MEEPCGESEVGNMTPSSRKFNTRRSYQKQDSYPENAELYVSEEGMIKINVKAEDDKTKIETLTLLLEKKEKDIRQAAKYGLSLLASNDELHLQLATLKIHMENQLHDLRADRDMYKTRHESAMIEINTWKRKLLCLEEEKYELAKEFEEKTRNQCDCSKKTYDQEKLIASLTIRVEELEQALMDVEHQQEQQQCAGVQSEEESLPQETSVHMSLCSLDDPYVRRLEKEKQELNDKNHQLTHAQRQMEDKFTEQEKEIKRLKKETVLLEEICQEKTLECTQKTDTMMTLQSKCSRLEREVMILEQISQMCAVVDCDNEEDDEDDEEYEGTDVQVQSQNSKNHPDQQQQQQHQETQDVETVSRTEEIFLEALASSRASEVDPPSPIRSSKTVKSFGHVSSRNPPSVPSASRAVPQQMTPITFATQSKLQHYFHLTALSIIHEHQLHEKVFNSSSRFTIDAWYQEIVAKGIPFLEWHTWLLTRIAQVVEPHPPVTTCAHGSCSRLTSPSSSSRNTSPTSSHSSSRLSPRSNPAHPVNLSSPTNGSGFRRGTSVPNIHTMLYGQGSPPPPSSSSFSSSGVTSAFFRLIGKKE